MSTLYRQPKHTAAMHFIIEIQILGKGIGATTYNVFA